MSKKQAQGLPLSISQNFLTSKRTIERLVRHACLTKHDTVLEIGAGKGHITRCPAQYSGSVIAYELDSAPAARFRRYSLHPMALPFPSMAAIRQQKLLTGAGFIILLSVFLPRVAIPAVFQLRFIFFPYLKLGMVDGPPHHGVRSKGIAQAVHRQIGRASV